MKLIIRVALVICLFAVNGLLAQESLVGKYGEITLLRRLEVTGTGGSSSKSQAKRMAS